MKNKFNYLLNASNRLDANKTKKLSEESLLEIKEATSYLDENAKLSERLYNIVHDEKCKCKDCGTRITKRFVSFVGGYKNELCTDCMKLFTVQKIKNTISNTEGNIVSNDEVKKFYNKMLLTEMTSDHWTQHSRAHYKDVYVTVELNRTQNNIDTWMESLYRIVNDIVELPRCNCPNNEILAYHGFIIGYAKHCSSTSCQWYLSEDSQRRGKSISNTAQKKLLVDNIGKYTSLDYTKYKNPRKAKILYSYNLKPRKEFDTLEDFDAVVPFYEWLKPEDFNYRYYYFSTNEEQNSCISCYDGLHNPKQIYCKKCGFFNDTDRVKEVNLRAFGYEYPSQRPEHKQLLRELFPTKDGMMKNLGGKEANLFFEKLSEYCINELNIPKENIFTNSITKEYHLIKEERLVFYDFVIDYNDLKICIEYNEHTSHPHIRMSKDEWDLWRCKWTRLNADTVFLKEQQKLNFIEEEGFKLLVVWEYQAELADCIDFIEEEMGI